MTSRMHVAALGAHGEGVAAGRLVVFGDDGARLHVVGDDAVVDDLDSAHACRLGESGIGRGLVAAVKVEGDIGAVVGPDQRCMRLDGRLGIDDDLERIVFDLDRFRRELRLLQTRRRR